MLMDKVDRWMPEEPTLGVIGMADLFRDEDIVVNPKRAGYPVRLMGLMAIYPKKNLSALGGAKYTHPYLLRGLPINRPNQVWAIDITYIHAQRVHVPDRHY